MTLPKSVFIRELGPREGFQTLAKVIPTEQKLQLISALADTGLREIEVTSFVRADKVPQMADAEILVAQLQPKPDVKFTALYLNERGFERARAFPVLAVDGWLYLAVSETFLKKNNNLSVAEALAQIPGWITRFKDAGVPLHGLMISTVFGCNYEGRYTEKQTMAVIEAALTNIKKHTPHLPKEISLADTMGWGNPTILQSVTAAVRKLAPNSEVSLHLHDTRGTGMANVLAGLQSGIQIFDCSIAGMGGCPFAKGAAGNVCTEDVAFLCGELGIETGVNLAKLAQAALLAEQIADIPLPGRYKQSVKAQGT